VPERLAKILLILAVLAPLVLAHALLYQPSEPFYNNDETRHVMTGVFFRDLLVDHPVTDLPDYTVRYYLQYPALGLLVWPPFFYAVEGVFMLAFGTSVATAKVLVILFAALACVYLFLLVARTHDRRTAAVAVLLFGFAPLMYTLSRQVMLEVPTLACALAAIYHGQRYLDRQHRRDLALCAAATVCATLTRFDGAFLVPCFLLLLVGERRLAVLRRREVLLTAGLVLLIVAPVYGLTVRGFGTAHLQAVREGTSDGSTSFLAPGNLLYYPSVIPKQIGWFNVLPALVGLVLALTPARRVRSWPYLALLLATYLTFTPVAELDPRHVLYWVPAFALFTADGVQFIGQGVMHLLGAIDEVRWTKYVQAALAGILVLGTVYLVSRKPAPYVRGYEEAARYVIEHTDDSPTCLFDSFLNGDFIYQVRRQDPDRRLWVLRGDKLFYGVLSDPHAAYQEWARSADDVLALIYKYDPEFIVIEDPQIYFHMPMPELLRDVLHEHPERFRLETTIPVQNNCLGQYPIRLEVYRNLYRNDHPDRCLEVEVLGMRRRIQTTLPGTSRPRHPAHAATKEKEHVDQQARAAAAAASGTAEDR
jgi:hypothetical protein